MTLNFGYSVIRLIISSGESGLRNTSHASSRFLIPLLCTVCEKMSSGINTYNGYIHLDICGTVPAFFKKHYGIDTFYTAVKVNLLNNRKILFQLIFHKVSPVFSQGIDAHQM